MKKNKLYQSIADSLLETCLEHNITFIHKVMIEITKDQKIKHQELYNYLLEEIGMTFGVDSKLITNMVEITNGQFSLLLIEGYDRNNNIISLKNLK